MNNTSELQDLQLMQEAVGHLKIKITIKNQQIQELEESINVLHSQYEQKYKAISDTYTRNYTQIKIKRHHLYVLLCERHQIAHSLLYRPPNFRDLIT